jgi:hypothetical protein
MEESPRGLNRAYLGLLIALMAATASARSDLFLGALRTGWRELSRGGFPFWKTALEAALFGMILLLTACAVPRRANPRKDSLIFAFGCLFGWIAEAWGTRAGVWRYYTGETPPLWIVPAWGLAGLVIDRASRAAERRFSPGWTPRAQASGYYTLACAFAASFALFVFPASAQASSLGLFAAFLAGLLIRPRPSDFWLFATGAACVFFADFWGVTNRCWAYHTQRPGNPAGAAEGIAFGMLFDAALVLLSIKSARALGPKL